MTVLFILYPVSHPSAAATHGARYLRSSFSSSRDNRARTRICMRTVPVIRGERLIGGMWHREQFVMKTCSPVLTAGCGVAGASCFLAERAWSWPVMAKQIPRTKGTQTWMYNRRDFIFLSQTREGT
jgi:hypothetical protein